MTPAAPQSSETLKTFQLVSFFNWGKFFLKSVLSLKPLLTLCEFETRHISYDPCLDPAFVQHLKSLKPLSSLTWGTHAVHSARALCGHLNASCFSCLVLLGDFRGIPAGLSLRLFVLGTRSVWVLFLFLSPRPGCWWRPASQVAHTSKQEGWRLLVFRQTSLTFFVVWGTGGTAVYLQRISPAIALHRPTAPSHRSR